MANSIKIWFEDFWGGFIQETLANNSNFLTKMIFDDQNVIITNDNPDLLFFSCFGNRHAQYSCKKIFWTGENVRPNFSSCDLSLSFDYSENQKNYRFPCYSIRWFEILTRERLYIPGIQIDENSLLLPKKYENKSGFCAFVHGNGGEGYNHWGNLQDGVVKRNELLTMLSDYKKVDSAGTWRNNMGYTVDGVAKFNFIKNYKFTFAIENSAFPGYVTEKMIDPMSVGSVPIYWGSEKAIEEFNPKSFVNAHNFSSNRELVEYIIFLDSNEDEYLKIYEQPFITGNSLPSVFDVTELRNRVFSVIYPETINL
jgi:hypothetical protein